MVLKGAVAKTPACEPAPGETDTGPAIL